MIQYLSFLVLAAVVLGVNRIGRLHGKRKRTLFLLGILLIPSFLIFSFPSIPFGDFNKAYYPAGRQVIENPSGLYYEYEGELCRGFVNMPILAFVFTPISLLPLKQAQIIFLVLSASAILLSGLLLVKLSGKSDTTRMLVFSLLLINGPLYYSVRLGNTTHFILLLLLIAFVLLSEKRDFYAGILLGVCFLFKIPLAILGLYFVIRKKWATVAGIAVCIFATSLVSLLLFGVDLHEKWCRECVLPFSKTPLATYNVQSVDGFLTRLTGHGRPGLWIRVSVGPVYRTAQRMIVLFLAGTVLGILLLRKTPERKDGSFLEMSMMISLALLISPISWTHYYLLLLIPLSLCFSNASEARPRWLLLAYILAVLLISAPVTVAALSFRNSNQILQFLVRRVFISHYFFGNLLLLTMLCERRWRYSENGL